MLNANSFHNSEPFLLLVVKGVLPHFQHVLNEAAGYGEFEFEKVVALLMDGGPVFTHVPLPFLLLGEKRENIRFLLDSPQKIPPEVVHL